MAAPVRPNRRAIFFERFLALSPGQPCGFPAGDLTSLLGGIERTFEPIRDIAAVRVTRLCHRFRSLTAAGSRPAQEEQLRALLRAGPFEQPAQLFHKAGIDPAIGKRLPLDRQCTLVQRGEVRKSDKSPFRSSPHIDQNSLGIRRKTGPSFGCGHILDFTSVDQTFTLELTPLRASPMDP